MQNHLLQRDILPRASLMTFWLLDTQFMKNKSCGSDGIPPIFKKKNVLAN